MKQPKTSIIILNWNGWKDTIGCLDSLSKISYPHYEVIVVDNASNDDSLQKIREWTKKKLIKKFLLLENDKNYGFAEGNNIAIRHILKEKNSTYILFLNNDTIVDKKFLSELIKVARNNSKAGIVGSKIYYYPPKRKENRIQSCGAEIDFSKGKLVNYGDGEIDQGQFSKTKKVGYVYGASMLAKQKVLDKIGFFDKKFFAFAEEADLCFRAKKAGYLTFFAPKSIIWHKAGASVKKVPGFSDYYRTRNLFWLERKHTTSIQFFSFLVNYFFQLPWIIYCQYLKPKQFFLLKAYLRGLRDGILGYSFIS